MVETKSCCTEAMLCVASTVLQPIALDAAVLGPAMTLVHALGSCVFASFVVIGRVSSIQPMQTIQTTTARDRVVGVMCVCVDLLVYG